MKPSLIYGVKQPEKEIEIYIGSHLLDNEKFLKNIFSKFGKKLALITDSNVAKVVTASLCNKLNALNIKALLIEFKAGEASKTRSTKEEIESTLFAHGFGREDAIVAVGGGVVTDLAGFVAATFCRGIPFINISTSLLGMVDASIGGKTGLNTPEGKNLIGSIYQPDAIILDVETLNTLPDSAFREGLAECIKHGAILDKELFELLEKDRLLIMKKEGKLLEKILEMNCRIKSTIVTEDEKENGKRRLLNFGHTLGHAIEKLSNFSVSHGDAVALGMLLESKLFVEKKMMDLQAYLRLEKLLKDYGFPLTFPKGSSEDYLKAMAFDKKTSEGRVRFVAIRTIGEAYSFEGAYCTPVDAESIKKVLKL